LKETTLKKLCVILSAFLVAAVIGCGQSDPNKDLKPIDPNAPRPKIGTDQGTVDKAATPP
jgi:hypothetical protein